MRAPRTLTVLTAALCLSLTATAQDKPKQLDPARNDHFGAGITESKDAPLPLTEVMKDPAKFAGKPIRVTGPITDVCQTKGCWMTLGKPAAGQPPFLVKFKDYAFFVPKDAAGRDAIIEGELSFMQETVEQTRHYLEDAGKHEEAKKVTEGRKILKFMANGVAIAKPIDLAACDQFGDGVKAGAAPTSLDEVMKDPAKFAGKPIRVTGPITDVCQTKGCWMTLGKPAAGQPPFLVKFKDYAFFVPKDAAGRDTVIEGELSFMQETVEQTRHYLEDAGKHEEAKKVTEGRKILKFMASGVAITKPAKAADKGEKHDG
ncbi:MAG: DUF4920 domain-containing protein [Planctomycetota bacterium]